MKNKTFTRNISLHAFFITFICFSAVNQCIQVWLIISNIIIQIRNWSPSLISFSFCNNSCFSLDKWASSFTKCTCQVQSFTLADWFCDWLATVPLVSAGLSSEFFIIIGWIKAAWLISLLYVYFLLNQENPSFDPWLTPHSCGQSCSKALKPECGHDCLLLCHPGNKTFLKFNM